MATEKTKLWRQEGEKRTTAVVSALEGKRFLVGPAIIEKRRVSDLISKPSGAGLDLSVKEKVNGTSKVVRSGGVPLVRVLEEIARPPAGLLTSLRSRDSSGIWCWKSLLERWAKGGPSIYFFTWWKHGSTYSKISLSSSSARPGLCIGKLWASPSLSWETEDIIITQVGKDRGNPGGIGLSGAGAGQATGPLSMVDVRRIGSGHIECQAGPHGSQLDSGLLGGPKGLEWYGGEGQAAGPVTSPAPLDPRTSKEGTRPRKLSD